MFTGFFIAERSNIYLLKSRLRTSELASGLHVQNQAECNISSFIASKSKHHKNGS